MLTMVLLLGSVRVDASVNGVASCGSKFLSDTARNEWNFTGYIVSDCKLSCVVHTCERPCPLDLVCVYLVCLVTGGGVGDIRGYEHVNDTMAAAIGLRDGGVDINCGSGLTPHICDAIDEGLVNISVLDASLQRSLGLLFDAGMFDPLESQPYTNIGFDAIGSDKAKALVQEASAQAMVLLKNDAKVNRCMICQHSPNELKFLPVSHRHCLSPSQIASHYLVHMPSHPESSVRKRDCNLLCLLRRNCL